MVLTTMLKQVLVTGSVGQLGQSIQTIPRDYSGFQFTFVDREELDLSNPSEIKAYFKKNDFDIVINCAAYTAVDKAESETELADKINHLAVKQLAEIAKQNNSALIHISTDYVFNGENHRPYIEADATDPQSIYGATKLKGELAFQKTNPMGCVIRTSWVYSEFGQNFVKTMQRLGRERDTLNVIYDQIGSPTYACDLAQAILHIIQQPFINTEQSADKKVFHFSNEGVCSWYDFAKTIFEMSHIDCQVSPIETIDYPTPAKRPHYSLLNKSKIKSTFELEIPYWKDALQKCINNLQEKA